jgi:predicted regulator of Ras-like GTPase activity (Roadblock/LC7/MglB family)
MSNTTRFSLSDEARGFILTIFDEMMDMCSGITGLVISTVDGHAVLFKFTDEPLAENRISAMTSSLLALGESLSKESRQSLCRYVIVQNADGYVITQRFGKALVLTAIADKNTNLGSLHTATRVGTEKLSSFNKT